LVADTVTLKPGSTHETFPITAKPGGAGRAVVITATLGSVERRSSLTIGKAAASLVVLGSAPQVRGRIGDTVRLQASLTREADQAAVPGKLIAFKIGNAVAGSATTADSGIASLDYTITEPASVGVHPVTVEFAGDHQYARTLGVGSLAVAKSEVTISVKSDVNGDFSGAVRQRITLQGNLTRSPDRVPLPGRQLHFKIAGVTIGTAATSGSGSARISFRIPASLGTGAKIITAEFAGDAAHLEGSGTGLLTVTRRRRGRKASSTADSAVRGPAKLNGPRVPGPAQSPGVAAAPFLDLLR